MSIKKSLARRLLSMSRTVSSSSSQALANCSRSASAAAPRAPPRRTELAIDHDPGDGGVFRRFLHRKAALSPEARMMAPPPTPIGEGLMERLRALDIARNRIRISGPILPAPPPPPMEPAAAAAAAAEDDGPPELTVEDARKLMRVARVEMVKSRLREAGETWVPYPELVRICGEACSDPDEGLRLARRLDETGNVVVLGKMVLLRPELVGKAIEGLMPPPPRSAELEAMERRKAGIDREAESLVRRELWMGLGYLVVQTAGFMRLTFWELTWDVMEPICFYLTSVYFMLGYAFFLRTSREPSFEGFFQSRFAAKQEKLMRARGFDVRRYDELRKACRVSPSSPPLPAASADREWARGVRFFAPFDTEKRDEGEPNVQKHTIL
ncbi:calcium uniporter protein 2, mitochondrial-like [Syzygium oleosum]|uniref:calcium uniporter protein 2, mitochondrial-like n=1 Tax=Syzygium oleosum TaxID=219896 RepID=UPI0024B8A590|nr:calcium uniporter protein 2, mitochondrial-like [Syzygium oleosum]